MNKILALRDVFMQEGATKTVDEEGNDTYIISARALDRVSLRMNGADYAMNLLVEGKLDLDVQNCIQAVYYLKSKVDELRDEVAENKKQTDENYKYTCRSLGTYYSEFLPPSQHDRHAWFKRILWLLFGRRL